MWDLLLLDQPSMARNGLYLNQRMLPSDAQTQFTTRLDQPDTLRH